MSLTTNPADRTNPLTEFLAESASSRPGSPSASARFSAALEDALVGMGFSPDQVAVSISQAPGGARQFLVTLGSAAESAAPAAPEARSAPLVGDGLPEYDPTVGPRISKDMWTVEMLTGDLSAETLRNVRDPSDLLQERLLRAQSPTPARVVSDHDDSSTPLNSSFLSTREQAEAMRERLIGLGLQVGPIEENLISGGPFSTVWGGEERRQFLIDGHNVGLLLERYARNPTEFADQQTLDEFLS